MAKVAIRPGSTSVSLDIFIRDSSVTTGAGLTGLVFNTGSLTAYYKRNGNTAPVAITLATLAAITTAWSSGGFIAADGTNTPGQYRLDVPDAVFATGVRSATIMLKGAANMEPCVIEVDLTNDANVTAINGVDLTTGVGPIAGTGIIDRGTAQSATGTTLVLRSAAAFADSELIGATVVIRSATTGAGQARVITAYVGSTDTATVDTWTTTPTGTIVYEIFAGSPASTSLVPNVSVTKWNGTNVSSPATAGIPDINVKNINNVTAPTPGAAGGLFIAGTNAATSVTTALTANIIGNVTGNLSGTVGTVTNLTNAPTAGDLTATMKASVTTAATAATPTAAAVTAAVTVGTNSDKTGYSLSNAGIDALFTRQLTESYAADGVAPTIAQAVMLIQQSIGDFAISGTTLTIRKLDGVTSAGTYTLDSSTAPTSRTRAT